MSILYPDIEPDDTGCAHRPKLVLGAWVCGGKCGRSIEARFTGVGARVRWFAVAPVDVVEPVPVCGECGAKYSDTDAMWQVRGCVTDLEAGVSAGSVARRMRRYLGMPPTPG